MEFDNNIYFSFLMSKDVNGAKRYLEDCVPDYLFKFYSLSKDTEMNEKKFNTLSANMNWYDAPKHQNDPFDMKLAYVDENLAKEKNACPEAVETSKILLSLLQGGFALCSFCDTDIDNFPMWAFYANNHQGYWSGTKWTKRKIFLELSMKKSVFRCWECYSNCIWP